MNLRDHLKMSNNWNERTTEDVWWAPHSKAIANFGNGSIMVIQKFIHNRWSCNERENIFYPYRSDKCRLCSEVKESQAHVLQCPKCPKRKELRKNLDKQLLQYFVNTETSVETARVLRFCMSSWLNNVDMEPTHVLVDDASQTLKDAVLHQSNIGWENLFRGRMSESWSLLYNYDLKYKKNEQKHMTVDKWGKDFILILWKFVYECWQARNDTEHDVNGDPTRAKKEKILSHIQWLVETSDLCKQHACYQKEKNKLVELPLNNLLMMEHQLSNLAKTDKIRTKEKQGKQPKILTNNIEVDN
jgi:hypothetical protein